MLPSIALLMLAVLPFVLLSVFVGISGLPFPGYEKVANDRARSVLHETGQVPQSVTVFGRQVAVRADELDLFPLRQSVVENRGWRKAMIEQAMVNTCITLQARCGKDDVNLLWAFMPGDNGRVSDIRAGPVSSGLTCEGATDADYAEYGRHLFREAIPEGMLSEELDNTVLHYHYSRPQAGAGCSFYDMVDLR